MGRAPMAYANFETREIHCKVLYLGAPGAGKTANLRSIYRRSSIRLTREPAEFIADNFAPYEFIPLSLGQLKDFHVKLHVYTMPEHGLYPTFNMVLLKGIDGLVFVVDSCLSALQENLDSWQHTKELLTQEGINFSALPRVIQYNKRDHEEAIALDVLKQELNPNGLADIEAVATQHIGTLETIQKISGLILDELGK
jgi:signal recognition particle receptor subunit beta